MASALRHVRPDAIVVGWDFSTGSVKGLAFEPTGTLVADVRLPTDLWTEGGVSELNLMQLEGQTRTGTRLLATKLKDKDRLKDWVAVGISATHHSAGRIDAAGNQVRRAICWNDQTLAKYHAEGLARLGGQEKVKALVGGPWAVRYSLSHLVKDEEVLPESEWKRTRWVLPHGPLAAGYLTGRFDVTSISSAASTGILDLRTNAWRREMLGALADAARREMAWANLPRVLGLNDLIGPLAESVALDALLPPGLRPLVFPTVDDQAAGLIGGGATDAGHVAVILGNSAVVNSSAAEAPKSGTLDAMKLNHGPYLWMRCYSNGAQFVDHVVGKDADWQKLEAAARAVPAGCNGTSVLPFVLSEPSIGVTKPRVERSPAQTTDPGVRARAAFEAVAYLIGLAVKEHEAAGQSINRVTVSGGLAKSDLVCEILASVLNRRLERLMSDEGPALGAAVTALAGHESHLRTKAGEKDPYTVTDAVAAMVKFKGSVEPNAVWAATYRTGLAQFANRIGR
jgi:sugar (pentulose or hexulose) kinase